MAEGDAVTSGARHSERVEGRRAFIFESVKVRAAGLMLLAAALGASIACPRAIGSEITESIPIASVYPRAGTEGGNFGMALDVSGDVMVVGAWEELSYEDSGSVSMYRRVNGVWLEEQKFGPDASFGRYFGHAVALDKASPGARCVVGAFGELCPNDPDYYMDCGEAFVFTHDGTDWTQTARLSTLDRRYEQYFGRAVAMDGDRIAVGAPYTSSPPSSTNRRGAVHVFEFDGSVWSRHQVFGAVEITRRFGREIELEGDVMIVSAPEDATFGDDNGAAFVFRRNVETGLWEQVQRLLAPDPSLFRFFGKSLALDGSRLLVGATDDVTNNGTVFVFEEDESSGLFFDTARLSSSDETVGTTFGRSVDLRGDVSVIGGPHDDPDGEFKFNGAAWIFRRVDGAWTEQEKIVPLGESTDSALLGWSVRLTDEAIVTGVGGDDTMGTQAGAVFVHLRGEITAGNVDTGDGSCPADVLFVNGSAGNAKNVVRVDAGEPATVSVERAPDGNGGYAFWIYDLHRTAGLETLFRREGQTFDLGTGVQKLPLENSIAPGSVICPFTFWGGWTSHSLTAQAATRFCVNASPGFPRAPTSFNAIFPRGNFLVGGVVTDRNSPNSPALDLSIANWVFVRSR